MPGANYISEHFQQTQTWIQQLGDFAKGHGLTIEWKEMNFRQIGKNRVPVSLRFDSARQVLDVISKNKLYTRFTDLCAMVCSDFPDLAPWIWKNPHRLFTLEENWARISVVLNYLLEHRAPAIYVRQLALPGVDTKFIENNRKILMQLYDSMRPDEVIERKTDVKLNFEQRFGFLLRPVLVRLRFLDRLNYVSGLSDITLRSDELNSLNPDVDTVFVVENDINALSFPLKNRSLVLFGRGYGFENLAQCIWLAQKKIYYWGDIDTHGFAILNQFRSLFPGAASFFMDRQTLLACKEHWVREKVQLKNKDLFLLTDEESALYRDIAENRFGDSIRLEQELIPYDRVLEKVTSL